MAYLHPFLRLVFSGTLYGVEGWSCGLTLAHVGFGDGAAPAAIDDGIVTAASTYFGSTFIGSHAALTTIKNNLIKTDGHYDDPSNTVRLDLDTPVPGGGIATALPQASLVVSLRTDAARGPAHAGRYYLPAYSIAPDTDGRLADDRVNYAISASTAFLDAINAVDGAWQVAVVSKVGAGAQRYVHNVRIGHVIDTMRSRRTSLAEAPIDGATLTHG